MKTLMYTFYDRVACQCGPVNHARNEADAIRAFTNAFKDREDRADFSLLKLGGFDHDSGKIESLDVPEDIPVAFKEQFGKGLGDNGK